MDATDVDRTRRAYDTVAESYFELLRDSFESMPIERGVLAMFANLLHLSMDDAEVVEVGCGPGYVTQELRRLGLQASGVDLSPEMIAVARREFPGTEFHVGDMRSLDLADESIDGLVSYYSLIHIAEPDRADALAEFARVVRPGGYVLVAFHSGTEIRHLQHAYGHDIDLLSYRLLPDDIAKFARDAGLEELARVIITPYNGGTADGASLLFRKP